MEFKKLYLEPSTDDHILDTDGDVFKGGSSISAILLQNSKPVAPEYFDKVSTNPWRLIESWENSREFKNFVRSKASYRYKTVVDVLFSATVEDLKDYPAVLLMKQELHAIAQNMTLNFNKTVEGFLKQDLNLSESQVQSLKSFIKITKSYKKIKIKEIMEEELKWQKLNSREVNHT